MHTNSNRRTLKSACKRLNFNYFKDRLVHFNGTVVKLNKGIADVAVEQLKTDAVVKEFLKRLTHLKIEQDKKAEELRLKILNIII